MSMFGFRRPRGFNHKYIYSDERKARLKAIEEQAKRELGMIPPQEFNPEDLRGAFVRGTKHLRREKEKASTGRHRMHYGVLIFMILALLVLMYYLMTGDWFI